MRLAKPLNYSAKSPDRQCHKGEILAARADPGGLMQLPISNRQIAVALELQHVAPLAVHLDGTGGAAVDGEAVAFKDAHRGGILWPPRGTIPARRRPAPAPARRRARRSRGQRTARRCGSPAWPC